LYRYVHREFYLKLPIPASTSSMCRRRVSWIGKSWHNGIRTRAEHHFI